MLLSFKLIIEQHKIQSSCTSPVMVFWIFPFVLHGGGVYVIDNLLKSVSLCVVFFGGDKKKKKI